MLKKIGTTTAAITAAVVVFLVSTLPPAPVVVDSESVDAELKHRTARGAYHVHTTTSDGSADRPTVAAAAARAGLQFVIFTDHGDGTRRVPEPSYLEGVLCLDGVEISTNSGHYVAIDMPPASYPLGGDAAAVVEDVARLGGFGIAAHPHHPRPELAWGDWGAPIDGIEWINLDSEWRDDGALRLARVPFDYLLRPAAAIASLLDRPVTTLGQWDALERSRSVTALAAVDAHGSGRRNGEGRAAKLGIGPSYESSFRTMSNTVLLTRPFDGNAATDARLVLEAIRQGSVYSTVDALAARVYLRRRAEDGGFEVASPLPDGARAEVVDNEGRSRLEVLIPHAPGDPAVPAVISNWSGSRRIPPPTRDATPFQSAALSLRSDWRIEKDPASAAQVAVNDGTITVDYVLADGRSSQFVAAAADVAAGQPPFDQLAFAASAARPMRISVQLRFPDGSRWVKSVYLDRTEQEVAIRLQDMSSAGGVGAAMPGTATASSVLFVVDLVNSRPGDSGSFTIRSLRRSR